MKVLFLSGHAHLSLDPAATKASGGAELQVALLSRELTGRGHEVVILAADTGQADGVIWDGVKIRTGGRFDTGSIGDTIGAFPRILGVLREERPDWVVVYGWTSWLYVLVEAARTAGLWSRSKAGWKFAPRIAFVCALDAEIDGEFRRRNPVRGWLFETGMRRADARFGITSHQQRLFETRGMLCGLTRLLLQDVGGREAREKVVDLLWVARCHPVKRPHRFLDLAERLPGARCRMICSEQDDALFCAVRERAEETANVEFIEAVAYRDIQGHFDEARIFVNTSSQEGVPNTFVHAGLGRTAILSLAVNPDGMFDVFAAGLCAEGSFERLVGAAQRLLAQPGELRTAQDEAARFVGEWHENARNVEAFLEGLGAAAGGEFSEERVLRSRAATGRPCDGRSVLRQIGTKSLRMGLGRAPLLPPMIRVLHVIDHLGLGGAQTALVDLLRCRDRGAFDCEVAVVHGWGTFADVLVADGVRVHALSPTKWPPRFVPSFLRLADSGSYDVFHFHLQAANWLLKPLAAIGGAGVRVAHDHTSGDLRFRGWWSLFPDAASHLFSTRVIAVSAGVREFLECWEAVGGVEVVPNGVDTVQFRPGEGARSGPRLVAGAMGRLAHEKNFQMIPALAERFPAVDFVIAGEGPERGRIEAEIARLGVAGNCRLLGAVTDRAGFYRSIDVFLLTSLYEGLPMTVLEAMASDVPVLSSRLEGVEAAVDEGIDGLMARPGDVEDFANALSRLVAESGLRERIGGAGRSKVQARYSAARTAAAVERVYREEVALLNQTANTRRL